MVFGGSLTGKVAFVTGAGSGIGRSTCVALAREGAKVVLVDHRLSAAEETLESMCRPEEHMCLGVDVADADAVDAAVEAVRGRYGQPADVVVNSAGITGPFTTLLDLDVQDLRDVFRVNVEGTFLVMRACARALKAAGRGGSVINISSMGCRLNLPTRGHYAASKGAVCCITSCAAKEWGPLGIRCNAVLPGMVDTPMTQNVPDKVAKWNQLTPMGRMAKPEEIADVVLFLASDRSGFVTGSDVPVAGGFN